MPDGALFYTLLLWFGLLLSAAFGNPTPEEILMISGGIQTARMGEYGLFRWLMLPACTLGAFLADVLLYAFGRLIGSRLLESRVMRRLAPAETRARIQDNFHRYGIAIFVIGRLVPGIRTTLFMTAGTMRLPFWRFCLADGLGALLGPTLFFLLGVGLGSQFKELIEQGQQQLNPYKPILFLALLVAVLGYMAYVFFRHPIATGDPEEVPLIGHQIAAAIPSRPEGAPEAVELGPCVEPAAEGPPQRERPGH